DASPDAVGTRARRRWRPRREAGRGAAGPLPGPRHRPRDLVEHAYGSGTPRPGAPGSDCPRPSPLRSTHSSATRARWTFSRAIAAASSARCRPLGESGREFGGPNLTYVGEAPVPRAAVLAARTEPRMPLD